MHKNLHPSDVAFGMVASFVFGIFAISSAWNLYVLFFITVASIFYFFHWKIATLFVGSIVAGGFYYHLYVFHQAAQMRLPYDTTISFQAIVADEPAQATGWWVLNVSPVPRGPTIQAFVPIRDQFAYGDEIGLTGKIQKPNMPGDEPIIFSEKTSTIAQHKGFWLREWLITFKLAVLKKFGEVLPADEAALLGGITLGATNAMTPELKNALSLSGTSYIMSMYGYKIGVLAFAITEMCAGFLARRWIFLITGAVIILFVMMAGAGASAVRAGIMACLALVAEYGGRTWNIRNAIAFTAFAMLLYDPTLLIGNAGFELSFASLLGIIYLGPPLARLFGYADKGALQWKENVVVAFSAIVAIIPLVMILFGSFSVTAIFSNVLVGIAIPPMMAFGALVALSGFFSYYASWLIGRIAGVLLWYELAVIHFFSIWLIPIPPIFNSTFAVATYYAALIAFIFYERKQAL